MCNFVNLSGGRGTLHPTQKWTPKKLRSVSASVTDAEVVQKNLEGACNNFGSDSTLYEYDKILTEGMSLTFGQKKKVHTTTVETVLFFFFGVCLAAQCEIPPPYRAIPFEIASQRGYRTLFALSSCGIAHASLRYIFCGKGVSHFHFACSLRGKAQKGGGYRNWSCWDTKNPIARNRGDHWDSLAVSHNTGPRRGSEVSRVYTLVSRPMVYALFCRFPKEQLFGTEKKPWQPETWQDSALFPPPGNRAVFHFGRSSF